MEDVDERRVASHEGERNKVVLLHDLSMKRLLLCSLTPTSRCHARAGERLEEVSLRATWANAEGGDVPWCVGVWAVCVRDGWVMERGVPSPVTFRGSGERGGVTSSGAFS